MKRRNRKILLLCSGAGLDQDDQLCRNQTRLTVNHITFYLYPTTHKKQGKSIQQKHTSQKQIHIFMWAHSGILGTNLHQKFSHSRNNFFGLNRKLFGLQSKIDFSNVLKYLFGQLENNAMEAKLRHMLSIVSCG